MAIAELLAKLNVTMDGNSLKDARTEFAPALHALCDNCAWLNIIRLKTQQKYGLFESRYANVNQLAINYGDLVFIKCVEYKNCTCRPERPKYTFLIDSYYWIAGSTITKNTKKYCISCLPLFYKIA